MWEDCFELDGGDGRGAGFHCCPHRWNQTLQGCPNSRSSDERQSSETAGGNEVREKELEDI